MDSIYCLLLAYKEKFVAKIINFPSRDSQYSSEIKRLKEISDQIDHIIIDALMDQSIEYKELVGLVSHRLGSLLSHSDEKKKLWKVCQQIICEQGGITKK